MSEKEVTSEIIGAAIEVHKLLRPGLLEKTYQNCLMIEFENRGIKYKKELMLPIIYKGVEVEGAYRIDLLVENEIIIELKAVEKIEAIHKAQLLTYLKLTNKKIGLIINFNCKLLKDGITRMVL